MNEFPPDFIEVTDGALGIKLGFMGFAPKV